MNHCPKCGTLVATLPGVCGKCGTYVQSQTSARMYAGGGVPGPPNLQQQLSSGLGGPLATGPPPLQRSGRGAQAAVAFAVLVMVGIVGAVFILHSGTSKKVGINGGTETPTPVGPPLVSGVTDSTHRITVLFPAAGSPTVLAQAIDVTPLNLEAYKVTLAGSGATYVAGVETIPSTVDVSTPATFLDKTITAVTQVDSSTLISKGPATYQGFATIDFVTSTSQGFIAHRNILAGHTFIELSVSGADDPPIGVDTYFNTLQVHITS